MRIFRHLYQRAARGYSDYDRWSFDTYIASVIGKACRDMAVSGCGYPGDLTAGEWEEYLLGISEPLLRYAEKFDETLTPKDYTDAVEAMHRFSDRLGTFWD